MDTQTGLICATFVIVSLFVVYFTSLFAMKEKTYDEALEEQRQRQTLEPSSSLLKSSKTEKSKKEKKDKAKKAAKKSKEKESGTSTPPGEGGGGGGGSSKARKEQSWSESNESSGNTTPAPGPATSAADDAGLSSHGKAEHVEFKTPEIIVEDDASGVQLRQRRKSPSVERPAKSILVNKPEARDVQEATGLAPVEGRTHRSNSFEILRPKDEFELLKQLKKLPEQGEKPGKAGKKSDGSVSSGRQSADIADVSESLSSLAVKRDSEEAVKEVPHVSRKHKKQKLSNSTTIKDFLGSVTEATPKDLVKLINCMSLSNEEIQILIDALLNKQSDATEWTKKSDPLDVLKRQLREKESLLETEKSNSEALAARIKELRHDLDQEKSKSAGFKTFQEREMQTVHAKYLQQQSAVQERHRGEITALQNKWQSIVDDKIVALQKLQDEISRLQKALHESDAERSRLEQLAHLPREVEELQREKQEYETIKQGLQQTNNELTLQIQELGEHLETNASEKAEQERTHEVSLKEIQSRLDAAEETKVSLLDELETLKKSLTDLSRERDSLKQLAEQQAEEKEKNALTAGKELEESLSRQLLESNDKLAEAIQSNKTVVDDLSRKLKVFEDVNNSLREEKSSLVTCLNKFNANVGDNLAESVEALLNRLEASRSASERSAIDVANELQQLKEQVLVAHTEKDSLTKELESDHSRLKQQEEQIKVLLEEKKGLEGELLQVEGIKETLAQMEQKLAELENKSQIEQAEKRTIETKYDEVCKEVSDLRNKDEKESTELEQINGDLEATRKQLEEEKQNSKNLQSQCVRLKSLVQCGVDALNAEQRKVEELELRLSKENKQTTNGSVDHKPNSSLEEAVSPEN